MAKDLADLLAEEFGKDSEVYQMLVSNNKDKRKSKDQVTYTGALDGSRKNKQD
tara:strand:+ start:3168 stop:3326 length:159 start_codon:yes stop_codon:yes gene_type:complete